jgi:uncharacterized membrane protein YhdT
MGHKLKKTSENTKNHTLFALWVTGTAEILPILFIKFSFGLMKVVSHISLNNMSVGATKF